MIAAQALEPTQAEALRQEQERLQGAWAVSAVEQQGKPVPAEQWTSGLACRQWVFHSDRVVLESGDLRMEASYRLGCFMQPKTIDLTPTSGPERGKRLRGIYDLQPEALRVCLNAGTGKRPTEFTAPADSPWTLVVLQRAASLGVTCRS
jgi:uncharacterized protein (TIGR03067 family)